MRLGKAEVDLALGAFDPPPKPLEPPGRVRSRLLRLQAQNGGDLPAITYDEYRALIDALSAEEDRADAKPEQSRRYATLKSRVQREATVYVRLGFLAREWEREDDDRSSCLDRLFNALWLGEFEGDLKIDLSGDGDLTDMSRLVLVQGIRTVDFPPAAIRKVEAAKTPWGKLAMLPSREYPEPQRRWLERIEISRSALGQWVLARLDERPFWYGVLIEESISPDDVPAGDPQRRLAEFRHEEERKAQRRLKDQKLADLATDLGRNEGLKDRALRGKFAKIPSIYKKQ